MRCMRRNAIWHGPPDLRRTGTGDCQRLDTAYAESQTGGASTGTDPLPFQHQEEQECAEVNAVVHEPDLDF